jgi:hypothetical protein
MASLIAGVCIGYVTIIVCIVYIKCNERSEVTNLQDLTIPYNPDGAIDWNEDGVVVLENFIPEELMVAYEECWLRQNGPEGVKPRLGGWDYCTPYRQHKEIRDILCYGPLQEEMQKLIGEPAGVHLNLTGWKSTTRNWHQDSYLNPPHVGDYYAAAWIALDTIHPDSGPFQYVKGSHKWPLVTREKILEALDPSERDHRWPTYSERLLTPLFTEEIESRNAEVTSHLPKRGDVLLWHGRLLHRGSLPNVPDMERKSLIAHYSGINHRQDMPEAYTHGDGYCFPVDDESRSLK